MAFTQTISVKANSKDKLVELVEGWHRDQAGEAPGYEGTRVLSDRDQPDRFVIEVDFTSEEEAQRNNDRAETQAWSKRFQEAISGEPRYENFDVVHATR